MVVIPVAAQVVSFTGTHCPKKSLEYFWAPDNIQELNAIHRATTPSLCDGLERFFLGYFQGDTGSCRDGKKPSKWEFIWCWTHLHSQIRAAVLLDNSSSGKAVLFCLLRLCGKALWWSSVFLVQTLSPAKPTAPNTVWRAAAASISQHVSMVVTTAYGHLHWEHLALVTAGREAPQLVASM